MDTKAPAPLQITGSMFTGTAVLTTTRREAAGPYNSDVNLTVDFVDCGTIRITQFPTADKQFGNGLRSKHIDDDDAFGRSRKIRFGNPQDRNADHAWTSKLDQFLWQFHSASDAHRDDRSGIRRRNSSWPRNIFRRTIGIPLTA